MKSVDVAEISGDNEAALGWGEPVCLSRNLVFPKGLARFRVQDGDPVIEADNELVSGDDKFKGRGMLNAPDETCFNLSLNQRDLFFEGFNFREIWFDFRVKFFESGALGGELIFELPLAREIEALKFVDGMQIGFPLVHDHPGGVVESRETFARIGIGKSELLISLLLIGRPRDQLIVFREKAENASGLSDGSCLFAVLLVQGDGCRPALWNIEAFVACEHGTLESDPLVFGQVFLIRCFCIDAPEVRGLPWQE